MKRPLKERLLRADFKGILEKTAEILEEDPNLVREVISHQYRTTREIMENYTVPSIHLHGLGTFEVMPPSRFRQAILSEWIPLYKALVEKNYPAKIIEKLREEIFKAFRFRNRVWEYHNVFKVSPNRGIHMKKLYKQISEKQN